MGQHATKRHQHIHFEMPRITEEDVALHYERMQIKLVATLANIQQNYTLNYDDMARASEYEVEF
jgi:hypothetical protein